MAGRNHHGDPNPEENRKQAGNLRKGHVVTPTGREENNELKADLRRISCLGLWEFFLESTL